MSRKILKLGSAFSLLLAAFTLMYSYKLINEKIGQTGVIFFLIIITILTAVTLLFFKRFLKYYFNFKDASHSILSIIAFESAHNIFTMVFYDNLQKHNEWYFIFSTLAGLVAVGMLGVYTVFIGKLINISKKSTSVMRPFVYSFIVIPIVFTVSFVFSLITDNDIFTSLEFNDSIFFLTILKVIPFILLPIVFFRAYQRRKTKHAW